MARQPDDGLTGGLIRKGEARGLSPSLAEGSPAPRAAAPPPAPPPMLEPVGAAAPEPPPVRVAPPSPYPVTAPVGPPSADRADDPPLQASPPEDTPKRFTSFRLPVDLDEELRAMMYETRRSKQDLLISFVQAGIQRWRQERVRRR